MRDRQRIDLDREREGRIQFCGAVTGTQLTDRLMFIKKGTTGSVRFSKHGGRGKGGFTDISLYSGLGIFLY